MHQKMNQAKILEQIVVKQKSTSPDRVKTSTTYKTKNFTILSS